MNYFEEYEKKKSLRQLFPIGSIWAKNLNFQLTYEVVGKTVEYVECRSLHSTYTVVHSPEYMLDMFTRIS
jgi:hypothetical protein